MLASHQYLLILLVSSFADSSSLFDMSLLQYDCHIITIFEFSESKCICNRTWMCIMNIEHQSFNCSTILLYSNILKHRWYIMIKIMLWCSGIGNPPITDKTKINSCNNYIQFIIFWTLSNYCKKAYLLGCHSK